MLLHSRHLLGLKESTPEEIRLILETTDAMKEILSRPINKVPTLRGKTVVTLFFETSTRTRMSFELAAKRMGADVSSLAVATSAVQKGESLKDTIRTIEAMGCDCLIIRHSQSGAPHLAARTGHASVINAGDGQHEHPTQGLLDLYTIRERKGRIQGLHVAIVGDVRHSRVARSDIWGLKHMGARVTLVGPPTLIPPEIAETGVEVSHDLDSVLPAIDVLYILRIQLERMKKAFFPSVQEYIKLYGVHGERLARARSDLLVMHPGPMNIGLEITEEVATSMSSAVEQQVLNGVAVRMAVLNLLLTGGRKTDEVAA
jgi:aspartate carbamoyltransferase catalytic subunit